MYPKRRTTGRDRVMSGSYTAFEVEAERRRELLEHSLREAAERRTLDEANRGSHESAERSQGRGLAEVAASLFNRVGQRA
jgi:hypothetical protein